MVECLENSMDDNKPFISKETVPGTWINTCVILNLVLQSLQDLADIAHDVGLGILC